jgi:hypothetical protein
MQHDDLVRREFMRDAFRHYVGLPDAPKGQSHDDDWAPYVSEAEFREDEGLAWALLDVIEEGDDGKISSCRAKPGSPAEHEARAAAARLLRAGAWTSCGKACQASLRQFYADLARLLQPGECDDAFELVLRRRGGKKGPALSSCLNTSIAYFLAIKIQSDGCVEAAINDAARRYAISERTVWDVWDKEGKDLLRTWNYIKKSAAAVKLAEHPAE